MNSNQPSNLRSIWQSKILVAGLLVFALIGFADTAYLTALHYMGEIPPCTLLEGCEIVLTSEYSIVLGVPLALIGALYYLALVVMSVWYLDKGRRPTLLRIFQLSFLGFLISMALLYLQAFVIVALCIYCLASIFSTAGVYVVSYLLLRRIDGEAKKF
ncbi:MAG: vitamin K epoxide reductase [Parcubacteria group bacterium Gr01-1014_3]|nr:MAG: vitamin K epoxide reductase [Parcubacteria group bacterium Gr01-1014_3]